MFEKTKLLEFPKILDPRGNLTFLQNNDQLPFEIQRVFWTYDVPGGGIRGGHAFKTQNEIIIALSGSFDIVVVDSNGNKEIYNLNRSYKGLLVPANTWRHMENFSTNALAFHVCDCKFNQDDYIRDYTKFINNE